MINNIKDFLYNRDVLIGRPNVTLKDIVCKNITCNKINKFKKYKNSYLCECGYIFEDDAEIKEIHKMKLYCKADKCPFDKIKMDKSCLKCELIGER